MAATAIALQPQLLLRARELCGRRAGIDAEDLVGLAFLSMIERPPHPKTPSQLKHWLRTVAARLIRDLHGVTFESWEAVGERRTGYGM